MSAPVLILVRSWCGRLAAVVLTVVLLSGLLAVGPVVPARADEQGSTWSEAGAMSAARQAGRPVEVASLASETRRVMADPVSGSFVAEVSAFPSRVRTAEGWRPVAPGLVERADGRVAPGLSPLAVSVSGGGTGPLVELADPAGVLRLWWPGLLPAPVVSGESVVFGSVRPGVDLVVRTSVTSVAVFLVVWSREAAADPDVRRMVLRWDGEGLALRTADEGGGLVVVAEDGQVVFGGAQLRMWSAPDACDALSAVDQSDGVGAPVAVEVSGDELVVSASAEFLDDPATRFPVVIDPEFTVARYLVSWVMVWSNGLEFVNSSTDARVGYDGWDPAGFKKSRSYYNFAFDLAGKVVSSATLRHRQVHSPNNTCNQSSFGPGVEVWRSEHAHGSMTWTTQPYHPKLRPLGRTFRWSVAGFDDRR